jgi:putative spermidine/putrescine transport system permease protein
VPLGFLLVLFVVPLTNLLRLSVWQNGYTTRFFAEVFSSPAYLRILWWTLELAFVTSVVCVVLGYYVAYTMVTVPPRVQLTIIGLVVLPFWTSGLVRAYAWIALLGRGGILNTTLLGAGVIDTPLSLVFNRIGLYIGTVHIMLPYMILCLFSTMRGLDRNLVRAAHALGAAPSRAFLRVFLPLSMPGIASGVLLVFILSLGFFITPAILGGLKDETFVMVIERQMNELLNWHLAAALATVLLAVTLMLYGVFGRFVGLETAASVVQREKAGMAEALGALLNVVDDWLRRLRRIVRSVSRSAGGGTWDARGVAARSGPTGGRGIVVPTVAWLIVTMMVVPIAVVVLVSFNASYNLQFPPTRLSLQWFEKYFSRQEWVTATVTSFQVALLAAGLATTLGVSAALGLMRMGRWARSAVFALLLAPMIIPAIVYAVAIYVFFAPMKLTGTKLGMAIAHTVLVLPGTVVVLYAALQGMDESIQRAAASLGAGPWRRFCRITLPLIRPAVLAAALLAFLTSFDEVVIALFLGGVGTVTLPRKMYESIKFDTDPTITAASSVLIGLTITILLVCEVLRRQTTAIKMPAGSGDPG